jgi:hypothetical protein
MEVVVSQHHFILTSENGTEFILTTDSLKPYLVTEGKWNVKFLYLAGPLGNRTEGYAGYRLTSPFITTDRGRRCVILASFSSKTYKENDNAVFFDTTVPTPITQATDRLIFRLETLDGAKLKHQTGADTTPPHSIHEQQSMVVQEQEEDELLFAVDDATPPHSIYGEKDNLLPATDNLLPATDNLLPATDNATPPHMSSGYADRQLLLAVALIQAR